jgi:hypothetical protein
LKFLISGKGVVAGLSAVFVASFLLGLSAQIVHPVREDDAARQAQYEQIKRVFGPYRDRVREGHIGTIAACAGMVFGLNLLGSLLRSLGSMFIIPALFSVCSLEHGRSIVGLHGSTAFSVPGFLAVCGLEWSTYVLSAAAGANLGLAFLLPKFKSGTASRLQAVRQAFRESKRCYLIIGMVLGVQALAEMVYVRAVLLHGGTGVPLLPY